MNRQTVLETHSQLPHLKSFGDDWMHEQLRVGEGEGGGGVFPKPATYILDYFVVCDDSGRIEGNVVTSMTNQVQVKIYRERERGTSQNLQRERG